MDEDHEEEENWDNDLLFQKLRKITEHMIEQGQKSIDFKYKILGRVLSNYAPEEDDEEEDGDEEVQDTKGNLIKFLFEYVLNIEFLIQART